LSKNQNMPRCASTCNTTCDGRTRAATTCNMPCCDAPRPEESPRSAGRAGRPCRRTRSHRPLGTFPSSGRRSW
jgi:hypothetical protein